MRIIKNYKKADFSSDLHRDLYDYWIFIKGEKNMASRKDFNPMAIPHVLPNIFLFDVFHNPVRYKVRVCGTHNVKCLGGEVTGKWLDKESGLGDALERFNQLLKDKKSYYIEDNLVHTTDDHGVYSALVLPLSGDDENIDLILASYHYY